MAPWNWPALPPFDGPPCAPTPAVKSARGKRSAIDAPTRAVAEASSRSACRMSGRRRGGSHGLPRPKPCWAMRDVAGPIEFAADLAGIGAEQQRDPAFVIGDGRDQRR